MDTSDYEAAGISADELAGTHHMRIRLRDDRGELELCFHEDERIIQILATAPGRMDVQDIVFSLIEVPMILRALDDIWRAEQVSGEALAALPPFDITFAMTPDQDAALLVDVLTRFSKGEGPFTAGDATRGVEAIQRLRATAATAADAVGWIVANGDGTKWRTWGVTGPEWTDDRDAAIRYARRADAEKVHAEDEDAWTIAPYAPGASTVDYEPAFRALFEPLSWMQENTGLRGYWGMNLGDIASELIWRAYPGLRAWMPAPDPTAMASKMRSESAAAMMMPVEEVSAGDDIVAAADASPGETLRFLYRNYRGEVDMREVRMPIVTYWGETEFHPFPQWLVAAFDVRKGADRVFALKDMRMLHDIFPSAIG